MTKRTREPDRWLRRFFRIIYDLAFFVFALAYLPVFLVKGKHRAGFGCRLGRVPEAARRALAGKRVIWVHGVSVGEVVQAFRLVQALRSRYRDAVFLVTTTTATGFDVASKLKEAGDRVLYLPADFRFAVRSFIDQVTPSMVVILETELWPNLIYELSDRDIPVYLVNGRISDKALPKYKAVRGFLRGVLGRLEGIGVQDGQMLERFLQIGADPARVRVTGNMKFDWQPQAAGGTRTDGQTRTPALKTPGAFLCVAGSTHEGEEEIMFQVYRSLKTRYPNFELWLAPRHPERAPSIERQAALAGVPVSGYS